MIGLSKEDVERIIRDLNIDHEHKEIAGTLREGCHELSNDTHTTLILLSLAQPIMFLCLFYAS